MVATQEALNSFGAEVTPDGVRFRLWAPKAKRVELQLGADFYPMESREGWFERVENEFPDHPAARDALSQEASALSRLGKPQEAVAPGVVVRREAAGVRPGRVA